MAAPFHYQLELEIVTLESKNEVTSKTASLCNFHDPNPIQARQEAFTAYDNWIKELYVHMGKEGQYVSDRKARLDFKTFQSKSPDLLINGDLITFESILDLRVSVLFHIDEALSPDDLEYSPWAIHEFGLSKQHHDATYLIEALLTELDYYEAYQLPKGTCQREIIFSDGFELKFLNTPHDWDTLSTIEKGRKGLFDLATAEVNETDQIAKYRKLITDGESKTIEFKPSLCYHFDHKRSTWSVKRLIAKTIAAFLNTEGGYLFIGVKDDGTISGIADDLSLDPKNNPKDFFLKEFDSIIRRLLGSEHAVNLNTEFLRIDNKTVFLVKVKPSRATPAFVEDQNCRRFYVRGQASSNELYTMEAIERYIRERWPK